MKLKNNTFNNPTIILLVIFTFLIFYYPQISKFLLFDNQFILIFIVVIFFIKSVKIGLFLFVYIIFIYFIIYKKKEYFTNKINVIATSNIPKKNNLDRMSQEEKIRPKSSKTKIISLGKEITNDEVTPSNSGDNVNMNGLVPNNSFIKLSQYKPINN